VKVTYDPNVDILNIVIKDGKISESDEIEDDVVVDYDKKGKIVSMEILDANGR
jgi:uncharacterized protein YuzE